MDSTGSIAAIEAAIDRLNKQRNELEELWAMRKMKLDLYLRLRVFERDALEVIISIFVIVPGWSTFKDTANCGQRLIVQSFSSFELFGAFY